MAIKVNGTTVINDSRALSNITSVDATTASAIGAAGVGGSLEFLSETNITSNVSYIDISFPTGYRGFNIALNHIFRSGNNEGASSLLGVLKNSSGNLVTTQNSYTFSQWDEPYWYVRGNWPLGIAGPKYAFAVSTNVAASTFITINNPRDADVQTSYVSRSGGFLCSSNTVDPVGNSYMGNHKSPEDNSGIRLSLSSGSISNTSNSYAVWGIK